MPALTTEEALEKRKELLELGYTLIPGVLSGPMLDEVRRYTDEILDSRTIPHQYRYQGSDIHVASQRLWERIRHDGYTRDWSPIVDRLIDLPEAWDACRAIGLEGQRPDDGIIILSKPPGGPALYWHQDNMDWNHPLSLSPWPTKIFLSYYMVDTTRENGCLRILPGTHLKRIPLHDVLPAAHEHEIQAVDEDSPVFADPPEAVDVPVKAGDLVICDQRVLHAAWPNRTDRRRTLVLEWHHVFPFPHPPSWWMGPIPEEIRNADPNATYEPTRMPGKYLR